MFHQLWKEFSIRGAERGETESENIDRYANVTHGYDNEGDQYCAKSHRPLVLETYLKGFVNSQNDMVDWAVKVS